jgi:hypothetical protein
LGIINDTKKGIIDKSEKIGGRILMGQSEGGSSNQEA